MHLLKEGEREVKRGARLRQLSAAAEKKPLDCASCGGWLSMPSEVEKGRKRKKLLQRASSSIPRPGNGRKDASHTVPAWSAQGAKKKKKRPDLAGCPSAMPGEGGRQADA